MANPEHLKILKQGVEVWNRWREENPDALPDLQAANFEGADLLGVNLSGSRLQGADFRSADLGSAHLHGAHLIDAKLEGVNLTSANLQGAFLGRTVLAGASLVGANLKNANLWGANLADSIMDATILEALDLSHAKGLDSVKHFGPCSMNINTLEDTAASVRGNPARKQDIEVFLRGVGVPDAIIEAFRILASEPQRLYSCFISYSHTDKSYARRLHDKLQARGIRCWLDEHDLKPGDRILDVVNDAIRLHDKILLCCSETSLNSWWVKDEIRKAQEREHRDGHDIIIPLMVDRYLLDGWEDGMAADLRSRLAADFTGWESDNSKFEEQFERVVRALRTDKSARGQALESP